MPEQRASYRTPGAVLDRLMEGNLRFAEGRPEHPRGTPEDRRAGMTGQRPLAAVLGCSDSRVPPERVFDVGLGDLFVIRTAGGTADVAVLGSLEFAAAFLKVPVILVLAHEGCGFIKAVRSEETPPGNLGALVQAARPEVKAAGGAADAAKAHALHTAERIRKALRVALDPSVPGTVKVVPAYYDMETGRVDLVSCSR